MDEFEHQMELIRILANKAAYSGDSFVKVKTTPFLGILSRAEAWSRAQKEQELVESNLDGRTCALCAGDCHTQNIKNFSESTIWRERALSAERSLRELHDLLGRIRQGCIEGRISGRLGVSEFAPWARAGDILKAVDEE